MATSTKKQSGAYCSFGIHKCLRNFKNHLEALETGQQPEYKKYKLILMSEIVASAN